MSIHFDHQRKWTTRIRSFPENVLRFAAVCLLIPMVTGCQTAPQDQPLEQPRSDHPAYTLGPGDRVWVTVYDYDDLSGTFAIDDAGTIALPLIRRISVKGMTLPKLEEALTSQLLRNKIIDPKVSVDLVELRPFCVLGEVRGPGCFEYSHDLIVSKAIAMAGGYTYRARKNLLVITREDGRKVAGEHDTPVLPGDVLEVPERYF